MLGTSDEELIGKGTACGMARDKSRVTAGKGCIKLQAGQGMSGGMDPEAREDISIIGCSIEGYQ